MCDGYLAAIMVAEMIHGAPKSSRLLIFQSLQSALFHKRG